MFKKNANRPPMLIHLKKVQGGYKVTPNEGHALFQVKRIIRTMYRRICLFSQLISHLSQVLEPNKMEQFQAQ